MIITLPIPALARNFTDACFSVFQILPKFSYRFRFGITATQPNNGNGLLGGIIRHLHIVFV